VDCLRNYSDGIGFGSMEADFFDVVNFVAAKAPQAIPGQLDATGARWWPMLAYWC